MELNDKVFSGNVYNVPVTAQANGIHFQGWVTVLAENYPAAIETAKRNPSVVEVHPQTPFLGDPDNQIGLS